MEVNIGQIKTKNHPDYLFHDKMIVDIKNFDPSLLKIYKLSYKGIFSLNICYIKYIPTKTFDHIDDDQDYFYFFLDDVDGHIEENDGIKYLAFTSTEKKEAPKYYKKPWEKTKKQIEVINDDEQLNTEKASRKLGLNQVIICL